MDVVFSYYSNNKNLIFDIFLKDFIYSLKIIAKFQGDIVIFYDKIDNLLYSKIISDNVIMVKIDPLTYRPTDIRFNFILDYLTNHKYDNIIIADLDIWFQDSLKEFIETFNNGVVYTKDIPAYSSEFGYFLPQDYIPFKKSAKDYIKQYTLAYYKMVYIFGSTINLGLFGGKYNFIINKLKEFTKFNYNDFGNGGDQIIMTMLFDYNKDTVLKTHKFNYLAKLPYKNIDNILYTDNNEKIVGYHIVNSQRDKTKNYFHMLYNY